MWIYIFSIHMYVYAQVNGTKKWRKKQTKKKTM